MYCENCGNKLNKEKEFCRKCGNKVNKINTQLIKTENKKAKSDLLSLISMIIGIVSVVTLTNLFYILILLNIGGLVLGIKSKNKGKLKIIGIILNSISLVIKVVFFILVMLAMAIGG